MSDTDPTLEEIGQAAVDYVEKAEECATYGRAWDRGDTADDMTVRLKPRVEELHERLSDLAQRYLDARR